MGCWWLLLVSGQHEETDEACSAGTNPLISSQLFFSACFQFDLPLDTTGCRVFLLLFFLLEGGGWGVGDCLISLLFLVNGSCSGCGGVFKVKAFPLSEPLMWLTLFVQNGSPHCTKQLRGKPRELSVHKCRRAQIRCCNITIWLGIRNQRLYIVSRMRAVWTSQRSNPSASDGPCNLLSVSIYAVEDQKRV